MLTVAPFAASDAGDWDALVRRAPMGTLLHTRQFLGYHGDRLDDASLVVRDGRGRLAGVIPAAVDPGDGARVASHPGATFGGVVHDGSLAGAAMVATFAAIAEHYRERGFEAFRYAPVPFIYHERPSADDLYALFTAGAAPARCELSCAVDLESGP
ncbi:MAG: hypothetical protein QOJ12_69, partial [Thermoleophilales bacterium]|nr:hypothetical protein [Thermoleophilales bacterium]